MNIQTPEKFIDLNKLGHKTIDFKKEAADLLKVVNLANNETDVQSYIKQNNKWFIPGSLILNYDFGHHEAYVVPEQKLGAEYQVDYMLVGRNSMGYHVVLVEFEDVNVRYKIKSANQESKYVRQGLTQINDWRRWLDSNRNYFIANSGLSTFSSSFPRWAFQYCLLVSRKELMDDISNNLRGEITSEYSDLKIVSYDRLVECTSRLRNNVNII